MNQRIVAVTLAMSFVARNMGETVRDYQVSEDGIMVFAQMEQGDVTAAVRIKMSYDGVATAECVNTEHMNISEESAVDDMNKIFASIVKTIEENGNFVKDTPYGSMIW